MVDWALKTTYASIDNDMESPMRCQGVVGVNSEGKVIPTNTLFLTFGSQSRTPERDYGRPSKGESGLVTQGRKTLF